MRITDKKIPFLALVIAFAIVYLLREVRPRISKKINYQRLRIEALAVKHGRQALWRLTEFVFGGLCPSPMMA